MKTIFTLSIVLVTFFSFSQTKPSIRYEDKIRIKEAILIEQQFGEQVWKGYTKAPFAIVLIGNEYEFLINHPKPSKDFNYLERDTILGVDVYFRKQQFGKNLLATFPAVNGVSCIVVGTPENTRKTSTEWIVTLLHERFHQYQQTSENYFQDSLNLGISNGDTTGMWQLNYPFPYQDKEIVTKYKQYAAALKKAVEMVNATNFKKYYTQFLKARKKLKKQLPENDYKYLSFQLYQEGIARYVEYAFLEALGTYNPTKEVQKIKDFTSFKKHKKSFYKTLLNNITALKLEEVKRVCFYYVGFGEALLINKMNPEWKNQYLLDKFDISRHYPKN